jgi:pyruvate kinase
VSLRTSALTDKDREDLDAGVRMGVDLVAVSFVQTARDLEDARAAAAAAGAPGLPIIAKIEKPQAVDAIEEIITVSDGLMVARGDLGVEVPLETVPAVQKRIILAARRRGVPVILATQVLESMRTEPRPTRAEVTDAAHAVDERVDAIMLAGETAAGQYPIRAVSVLASIIVEAEKMFTDSGSLVPEGLRWSPHGRALCEAAVALADSAGAAALIAMTRAGKTARLLAAMRPNARILAVTPSQQTAAALALVWGVTPVITEHRAIRSVRTTLAERGLVAAGDVIVFVSAHSSLGHENINFTHVERV